MSQTPPASALPPAGRERMPWRSVGAGVTAFGTPVGIGVLHPMLGEAIAVIEVVVVLAIIGTALFGSPALSERAFRLLRWIGNRPEPSGPHLGCEPVPPAPPRSSPAARHHPGPPALTRGQTK